MKQTWGAALAALACLSLAAAAPAQTVPASEISVNYSFLKADPGEAMTEGGETLALDSSNLHGAEFTGTYYLRPFLGLDFSLSYHNGSITPPAGYELVTIDFKEFSFMAGPRVRLAQNERANASVRALVGATNGSVRAQAGPLLADADETTFALAFGGDVTLNLNDAFALRLIQPEVLFTWFGGNTQTNFRISAGIVFRVG